VRGPRETAEETGGSPARGQRRGATATGKRRGGRGGSAIIFQDQTISLEHISTKKMIADPLTKGLPPSVFREHLADMGLRESL
jgi:hypothetical protein